MISMTCICDGLDAYGPTWCQQAHLILSGEVCHEVFNISDEHFRWNWSCSLAFGSPMPALVLSILSILSNNSKLEESTNRTACIHHQTQLPSFLDNNLRLQTSKIIFNCSKSTLQVGNSNRSYQFCIQNRSRKYHTLNITKNGFPGRQPPLSFHQFLHLLALPPKTHLPFRYSIFLPFLHPWTIEAYQCVVNGWRKWWIPSYAQARQGSGGFFRWSFVKNKKKVQML